MFPKARRGPETAPFCRLEPGKASKTNLNSDFLLALGGRVIALILPSVVTLVAVSSRVPATRLYLAGLHARRKYFARSLAFRAALFTGKPSFRVPT